MYFSCREIGIRLVNAAKEAGVRHLLYVTLPDIDTISKVPFMTNLLGKT